MKGQKGLSFIGAVVSLTIVMLLCFAAALCFFPSTRTEKKAYKWINKQLSAVTGRKETIRFDNFFDAAMEKIGYSKKAVRKQDRELRRLFDRPVN